MAKYRCKGCEKPVVLLPTGDTIKACKCNTGIVAEVSAVAKGRGGMKTK